MISIKNIILSTIQIVIYGLIIYYMNYLKSCNCTLKKDWRHDFITIYAWIIIVYLILKYYIFDNISTKEAEKIEYYAGFQLLKSIMPFTEIIHIYAFFTYITDINEDKLCTCVRADKIKTINSFMVHRKYIFILLYVISIIAIIIPSNILTYTKNVLHVL